MHDDGGPAEGARRMTRAELRARAEEAGIALGMLGLGVLVRVFLYAVDRGR